jgi:hypothetical protein
MGLQFENLVMNNLPLVLKCLGISDQKIVSASPYFQKQTKKLSGLQIDLLIHCQNTIYICEIKFQKRIKASVMDEVQKKMEQMNVKRSMSMRAVLIYAGDLDTSLRESKYFDQMISFEDLLIG